MTTEAIWDGMSRLLEKIKAISKDMNWPELLSMVMTQVFEDVNMDTPETLLFDNEAYLMRLCLRYETFVKAPFNVVTMVKKKYEDYIRIGNYDFKTFVWAKKVYDMEIDNNFIYIPYSKLTPKQIEAFKKKAINNYDEQ